MSPVVHFKMLSRNVALCLILEEEEEEEFIMTVTERENHALMYRMREEEGFYELLINGHLKENESKFRDFFRLNVQQFEFVVSLVQDDLYKAGTIRVPRPISPEEKVALAVRYLATGETFESLAFAFRISPSYISRLVRDTLECLCKKLVPIFLPPPNTETLGQSAAVFRDRWNFPNCVGAIDGKHVRIFCPKNTGSLYYNYKDYFSIVLLALVDPNYKFIAVDVGSFGKEGDSGIFNKSEFGRKLSNSEFYPPDTTLPGSDITLPHVIVGDEAFRLQKHVMKPFNRASARADKVKATFNYRLSRARRVSENSFALLSEIWRVYYSHISLLPETADNLILVTCCLHNMLRDAFLEENDAPYYGEVDPEFTGTPNFSDLNRIGGFQQQDGFLIREQFSQYFSSEGAVSWQENNI